MANPITPYMGVELPVPGETGALGVEAPGKSWMELQNAGFQTMDAHDHTSGKGLPVPVLGINIDRDLPFNDFNAVGLRTARFSSLQAQPALATDLRCAYFYGGDFWVNDNNGNKIRITQNGSISGTSGSITGLVAPAAVIWNSVAGIFDFLKDANTRAGIFCGPVSIHEAVTGGKKITIRAPTSLAADYVLTLLTGLPSATLPLTVSAAGQLEAAGSLTLPNNLVATGVGTAPGVQGNAGSSSPGVKGIGNTSSSEGVTGTGGTPNGRGMSGFGTGTGAGVRGDGGSSGVGVEGFGGSNKAGAVGTGNGTGVGVEGFGGATNAAGVYGQGGGSGDGVKGVAGGAGAGVRGEGVVGGIFLANTATRGAINLVPQSGASTPSNGDMWVDTADNLLKIRINGANYSVNMTAL